MAAPHADLLSLVLLPTAALSGLVVCADLFW